MEMSSSDYNTPHVAQQSRRDKLRGSASTSLALNSEDIQTNFHTQFTQLVLPSEMFNFTPNSGSFSSIQPTRFVLPVSCDESRNGDDFKPPFVENWEGGGYGGSDNYQNNLQNWGDLHPSFVTDTNPNYGLSLSLSSNQISEIRRLGLKPLESANISSIVNQSVSSIRNLGPLGPFTGYTTILKGSKFLKPAQQILDEFLSAAGLKTTTMTMRENSSNSTADCSKSCDLGSGNGNGYGGDESYRPDCHEKKAKLINMQEEVRKWQKQYHQEIQMVMSAFESVPGIASATPYISRSLMTLSRHFKCLKNAIADQLRYIKNILGEDLSSPAASFSRGDYSSLRFGQNFAKVKSSSFGGSGYQNHIWRPQRGLPERAVSILRAWLFDHFLHPYPTDTDKQMLATQTGLSRNQVSNWFINARVRLWKPMVEEIHMLESKGVSKSNTEPNSNNSGFSSIPILKNSRDHRNQPGFQPKQFDCSGGPSSSSLQMQGSGSTIELKETSPRQITTTGMDLDGPFVGFLPNYLRRGLDRGGIGVGAAVSLTLGLKQGSETTLHHQQHQFQQQGMHFGSHIHDAENGL